MSTNHTIDEMTRQARIEALRGELLSKSFEVERAALAAYLFDYVADGDEPAEPVDGYENDWCDRLHGEIWAIIQEVAAEGRHATPAAVWSRLDGSALVDDAEDVKGYIASIGRSMAVGRASDAIRLVRDMANRRRLIDVARDLEEQAYRLDIQPAEVIEPAAAKIEAVRQDRQSKPRSLQEIAYRIADDLARPLDCFATGLPRLDSALGGGIFSGKLYGIAAKRKHGKTITLGTIASNIASAGVPTLFFALEMGEEGISQRIIARHLRTNSLAFLHRNNEHLERDTRRFADECRVPLFFEDRPGLGVGALKSMCAEYVSRYGIKVICIDYFQLIGGKPPRQSQAEHLDQTAQWMADFCKGTGVSMIVPSQLNRDDEARGGDGFRLACSMFLAQRKVMQEDQKTEGVWFEMMDSRYTPTADIGNEGQCPFYISKRGPHLAEFGQPEGALEKAAADGE